MSPHRTPGEVMPDGPVPLKKGPAKACAGCGLVIHVVKWCSDGATPYAQERALDAPRACTPHARVRVGWFRRCKRAGEHLHEHCRVCGLDWLTAFAEGS